MSGILKRKFQEVDGSSPRESDDEVSVSESGDSSDSFNPPAPTLPPASILKKEKRMRRRSVHFEKVTVYYFSRRQGFTSVPSQGGSTLGMSSHHSWVRQYSLGEFALEQQRIHRDQLRDHLKEEKLNSIKLKLTKNGTVDSDEASVLTVEDISDDDIDLDSTEVDEYFFLQPLTTRKRRALLRSSGVKKIDVEEKHELRTIRVSREDCGCDCRLFCRPETCACSLAGIKCQVDRMSFPCGCTKEGCSNTAGRIEFNPVRVRTHFLHTIMKLEVEKSREQHKDGCHGDGGHLAQAQRSLEYPLADGVPQAALMCLQASEGMDEPIEEEEEEEDEEEEEEEEDTEDDDSLCSGLTDSSTQSLAASESEEDDDDDDDDDDEDDDGDDKSDDFEERVSMPPVSHTEVVPLSSVLCFSDTAGARNSHANSDNHANGNSSYFTSSSAEYYQLQNPSSASVNVNGGQNAEPYGEVSPFRDRVAGQGESISLRPFDVSSEQYATFSRQPKEQYASRHFPLTNGGSPVILHRTPDQENNVQPNGVYGKETGVHSKMDFQNYLNNNSEEHYGNCFMPTQPKDISNDPSESPSLTESKKNRLSLESFPKVTPV
ncbi:cysteine/serine-rich nuclear protein 3-like [Conger conger]|uniref:cysteine/serine-rich nuclear protein 3-like n=1 Tax=Conger conger TaxID=82655 RepID=UPI002A5AA5AA|nr:cysteine/serine-rich nuclear protein 3-like [Conger conger]